MRRASGSSRGLPGWQARRRCGGPADPLTRAACSEVPRGGTRPRRMGRSRRACFTARVAGYAILPDDPGRIRAHLEELLALPGLEAVIVNGGTGFAPRDTTYEAITALLEKTLDGFGELFRMLSYRQVGSAAMLSRATAGVAR